MVERPNHLHRRERPKPTIIERQIGTTAAQFDPEPDEGNHSRNHTHALVRPPHPRTARLAFMWCSGATLTPALRRTRACGGSAAGLVLSLERGAWFRRHRRRDVTIAFRRSDRPDGRGAGHSYGDNGITRIGDAGRSLGGESSSRAVLDQSLGAWRCPTNSAADSSLAHLTTRIARQLADGPPR
jgi:hypothetical protein